MFFKRILLSNFKNHSEITLKFGAGIQCITGKNGVGKTNILDALHYLMLTRSFIQTIDQHNCQTGFSSFRIMADVDRNGLDETIALSFFSGKRKKLSINNNDYKKLSEHIGYYPLVMVSPSDQEIIYDGSEARRNFIDSILCQDNPNYLNTLIRYKKILEHRNQFLKNGAFTGSYDEIILQSLNIQLAETGNVIAKIRKEFIQHFIPIFQEEYFQISKEKNENVNIVYETSIDNNLLELLNKSLPEDKILQRTSTGIHKDDLRFEINNFPLKRMASQGQQKSFILSLKLAEYVYLKSRKDTCPIILLDDIFDKLDAYRMQFLLQRLSKESDTQVFITDTQKNRLEYALNAAGASTYTFFEL